MNNSNLKLLNGVRGLAALYVMVGHARWLLWEGYSSGYLRHSGSYSFLNKIIMYGLTLFSYGHQAVMLFFVLSGFVIHLRYAKQIAFGEEQKYFDWHNYLIRRLKRLYPPLLGAIIITLILDQLGMSRGLPIYFSGTPYELINQNIKANHSWHALLTNLCFLMTAWGPVWGTNGPLWSLMYEFWFYMIYPLFWRAEKKTPWHSFIILVGLALALSFVTNQFPILFWIGNVLRMMTIWWMGVLLANLFVKRIQFQIQRLIWLALGLCIIAFVPKTSFAADLAGGVGFVGIIGYVLSSGSSNKPLLIFLNNLGWLGDCSYTLYVCHFPILVFLSGLIMLQNKSHALPSHFIFVALGVAICLGTAYVLHFILENPFLMRARPN